MEPPSEETKERLEIGKNFIDNYRGNKFTNPHTAHRSIYSTSMARCGSQDPFTGFKISCSEFLDKLEDRSSCDQCGKSRKFFCYSCMVPIPKLRGLIPQIQALPCKIDVIKHANEHDGKSTSTHAAVIAPAMVRIYTFPDFPDYRTENGAVLIYPGDGAVPMKAMTSSRASEITKMIFIDSTWAQAKHIFKDPRLQELPCVVLESRNSLFWRYQRGKPDSYLATIEAIYYALVDVAECRQGRIGSYDGHFDDLLFFFRHFYRQVNELHFRKI